MFGRVMGPTNVEEHGVACASIDALELSTVAKVEAGKYDVKRLSIVRKMVEET